MNYSTETESEATGTIILADEPFNPLRWHHSVAFDGYEHTTACEREIDVGDVLDVELDPVRGWSERVSPVNGCTWCHGSVLELKDDDDRLRADGGVPDDWSACLTCGVVHDSYPSDCPVCRHKRDANAHKRRRGMVPDGGFDEERLSEKMAEIQANIESIDRTWSRWGLPLVIAAWFLLGLLLGPVIGVMAS